MRGGGAGDFLLPSAQASSVPSVGDGGGLWKAGPAALSHAPLHDHGRPVPLEGPLGA